MGNLSKHNPTVVWIMEGKIVMTILRIPSDSSDLPIQRSLPLQNQRACMVKHASTQPDGIPTYKGTRCDLMIHVSPLLRHVLSKRPHKGMCNKYQRYECSLELYKHPDGAHRE